MTTSFRSFAVFQSVGSETSIVVPVPSGVEKGDLLLCFMSMGTSSAIEPPDSDGGAIPTGGQWQKMESSLMSNVRGVVYMKHANASEPANYTWTFATGKHSVAGMIALKDPGAINAIAISIDVTDTPICPDVTLSQDCLVIRAHSQQGSDANLPGGDDTGYPTGTTGIYARSSTTGTDASRKTGSAAYETKSAGATGTLAFQLSTNRNWVAFTLGIESVSSLATATTTTGTENLNTRRKARPIRTR